MRQNEFEPRHKVVSDRQVWSTANNNFTS